MELGFVLAAFGLLLIIVAAIDDNNGNNRHNKLGWLLTSVGALAVIIGLLLAGIPTTH